MCDYSLQTFSNRLGTDGEDLVVYRFATGSLGLASPADVNPIVRASSTRRSWSWTGFKQWLAGCAARMDAQNRVPAVCIPPGARLILCDIPKNLQRELGVGEVEEVEFVETSAEADVYRDGVRFQNGLQLLLQELRPGQRVRLLTMELTEAEPLEVVWLAD
jgi:hypothetical protein